MSIINLAHCKHTDLSLSIYTGR